MTPFIRVCGILVLGVGLGVTATARDGGGDEERERGDSPDRDAEWKAKHCNVVGVKRRDYFIEFVSNLPSPNNQGPAKLDIHRVTPVFGELEDDAAPEAADEDDLKDDGRTRKCLSAVAVAVHGRSVDIVSVIDVQYKKDDRNYSLAESLAKRGIETFGVNLLGWGLSSRLSMDNPPSRFSMDDPCNTSTKDQNDFLKPNPLASNCPATDPFVFSNIDAQVGQLDAAVDHALAMTRRSSISLFAWSRGAIAAGPYAQQNPAKVKNIVFLAGSYIFPDAHPPFPISGIPMSVANRAAMIDNVWNPMVGSTCAGQQDPAIKDPIWESMKARDPLGATWGTAGVIRIPNVTLHGWNISQAGKIFTPTLMLTGLLDTNVPPAREQQLFTDLGSINKVLIRVACASHFMQWEGAASWRGPHSILAEAAGDWMIGETYRGATSGIFNVSSDGTITP
jgi:pimeloyl-ACP methyl ester carboxylesterase